jgi:hypothetical protein
MLLPTKIKTGISNLQKTLYLSNIGPNEIV